MQQVVTITKCCDVNHPHEYIQWQSKKRGLSTSMWTTEPYPYDQIPTTISIWDHPYVTIFLLKLLNKQFNGWRNAICLTDKKTENSFIEKRIFDFEISMINEFKKYISSWSFLFCRSSAIWAEKWRHNCKLGMEQCQSKKLHIATFQWK